MPSLDPQTRVRVTLGSIIAAVSAVSAAGGVYAVAQYRMNEQGARIAAVETRFAESEARRATDHELLVRIDERLAAIQRRLDGATAPQPIPR